ncbi:MAG TPA: M1 family aminopeptidase [Chitinophagaceae bacterium]|nr:M1 family aminopeptidase [Chitinophagaceae bacterium]
MRIVFTFLLLASIKCFAQYPPENCKSTRDIAGMERRGHDRITGRENATLASNNFDVKYYRCEWEVDPAIRYIKGIVTVYYITTSATGFIALDLMNDLVTDSVKQRGLLLTRSQSNNTLTINFGGIVIPGTLDSVSIYYQGIPANSGFGSFIQSTHAGIPVLWSLSEPYGSRDWWPCKNGLDDKADSIDVFVTNPIAYKAASNGILQSQVPVSGGTKLLSHWKHRYPIASYLICFAVTNYIELNTSVQLTAGILPMQTFCYPEDETNFSNGTINTLNAMQLFDNLFGNYPFMNEKYGHVQFGWGGGMEHQTSTFVVSIDESLCAHELGHQWFGDKITCASWKDIWLNEGFATHLASIYMENKYPASVTGTRLSEISNITSQPGGSVEVDDTTDVNRIFDYRLTYIKGSHLLYMLRWILGDSVFFTAIRNYQTDPAVIYGFARTGADLKRNLEQTSGKILGYFFNEWFSGQGYPSYNVQWSNLGAGNVWIKMNQATSHFSVPFFELPVALQFRNATQQATVVVDNKVNGETFIRSIGFTPDTVLIDPDAWLITRNNTSTKLPAVLPVALQHFNVSKNGCVAFIDFSTSFESDMASFEIELGNDGAVYTKATSITAYGNSNAEKNYSYHFLMQPGKNYFFRLKMIERNGSFTYSTVSALANCSNAVPRILLTPNPVKDKVIISGLPAGKNTLMIYDIKGQLLQTIYPVTNFVTIYLGNYASGIYLLRIQDTNGNRIHEKIVRE